ncbi:transmembrane BAX inhibitor motif containing 1a [Kryptolebias marmoratus]|uniref:Transmembrane BAX inhibitor motif containing 1a n=1 Tax=Kryptolebias marmoratus TaxID=37003 RepID=A0A3Q3A4X9_KRYMA|nr:transmembrane BAX inhibitor motif containing 1a [Kryptolebias marmoratus]XP_017275803.1 transmembrane BAX inhibitor motif containing 1a [Kryptolebias marmoratus]
MSRSDYPPGYDESHGPLYPPQGGGYPPPPAYGFPSYGGPQPGHPSAPYPSGPNAPLYPGQPGGYPPGPYPGQPGGYPPGPYPGQPHPAGPQGGGYPPPPPMPPVIPPTIPSDVLSSGDEFAAHGSNWDDLSIRHTFIRKVYIILASQLLVTTAIVAIFTFAEPVKSFVRRNQAVYWASYAIYFVTHMVLVCCKGPRRKFPWNIILLLIFTLALSYMTGTISSHYDTKAVFLALGITAVVCIAVTVFCFQTKVDFTKCQGLFCVLGIVMFVTGIIAAIVLSFKYIYWLHMVYAGLGAIVFTLFLAYHTQLLIGNRKHSISPEEYVFAALSIYVDIVQIFLFLLQIIGSSSK